MNKSPSSQKALYIFGLISEKDLPVQASFKGVPVEILATYANIGAVGAKVSLAEFGEEVVNENVKKVEWISAVATGHYAVCDSLFKFSSHFLPFRLCTVFKDEESLSARLHSQQTGFTAEFERLSGKAEFGFKVWANENWLTRFALNQSQKLQQLRADAGSNSGKAFFARKKYELELQETLKQSVNQLGKQIAGFTAQALGLAESEYKMLSLPARNSEGLVPLANLTLLLDLAKPAILQAFAEKLDQEFAQEGLIEISGAMPPYSFVK